MRERIASVVQFPERIAVDDRGSGEVLSQRELNRALLARQMLLRRSPMSVEQALGHLVGMQSQVPRDPYIGLWSRLEAFHQDDLGRSMTERRAVRASLMRATIHLVTARDALRIRPVLQAVFEHAYAAPPPGQPNVEQTLIGELLACGRALLEVTPRTGKALRTLLTDCFPDRDPAALSRAVLILLPLVQVTPRGVWGASHAPHLTTTEHWLGQPLEADTSRDELFLRYLAAFGPATLADFRAWSRLKGLNDFVARLRPRLLSFRDERKRDLLDLPDAPRPDPVTPAPPRFLPGFDNALLSHSDRTRIISEPFRKAIGSKNGLFDATYLIDGFVHGIWKIERTGNTTTLVISPFATFESTQRDELMEEGARLLTFIAPDAASHDIRIGVLE